MSAIHDLARKHRVRPEALPALLAETEARLAALAESADAARLARRAAEAEARYRALAARAVEEARASPRNELAHRVTEAMQALAMAGGRLEIALEPLADAGELRPGAGRVPRREPSEAAAGAACRSVASGGELSRIALAIQVVTSEVGAGADARVRRSRQPASAARSPQPSGGCCRRWARGGRCCASRTCRRSRRSPTRTFASPRQGARRRRDERAGAARPRGPGRGAGADARRQRESPRRRARTRRSCSSGTAAQVVREARRERRQPRAWASNV